MEVSKLSDIDFRIMVMKMLNEVRIIRNLMGTSRDLVEITRNLVKATLA